MHMTPFSAILKQIITKLSSLFTPIKHTPPNQITSTSEKRGKKKSQQIKSIKNTSQSADCLYAALEKERLVP